LGATPLDGSIIPAVARVAFGRLRITLDGRFIAGWAIATGVLQIIGAVQLRKEIDNEWLLILGGVISVLFGVGMMLAPGAGALALVWVIGTYAVILGVVLVALALRLKKHAHS
jgi:uncharacterized membrane protein HdeD (DUF308 family)